MTIRSQSSLSRWLTAHLRAIILSLLSLTLLIIAAAGYTGTADAESPIPEVAGAPSGSIGGMVSADGDGPLEGICVNVEESSFAHFDSTTTDATGSYEVDGLPAGQYLVQFVDCRESTVYVAEWYDDQLERSSASHVAVSGEAVTDIDAALAEGGSVGGTVTDLKTGDPIEGICVFATEESFQSSGTGRTDASGAYVAGGLTSGSFTVGFRDCNEVPVFVPEWYDDQQEPDDGDQVLVTFGEETSGIDASLALGGRISGAVSDISGSPLEEICVFASELTSSSSGLARTDAAGFYAIGGLRTGDFVVSFRDCNEDPILLAEWWDDQEDFLTANPASVTMGEETAGIDAQLAVGGSINGRVIDEADGRPLSEICVTAWDTSFFFFGSDETDAFGNYSMGGLRSGTYTVSFRDCGSEPAYLSETYDDCGDFEEPDLVTVTSGMKNSGIDAALAPGGSINGTVTDETTGDPLSGICVEASDASFSFFGFATTDASGNYTIDGLASAEYSVFFSDCNLAPVYVSEWYENSPGPFLADSVPVSAGAKTSSIDAALAVGGSINGVVTDEATGDPLSNMCVAASNTSFSSFGVGETDSSGFYSVGGLGTGDFFVAFGDCVNEVYLTEWYMNRAELSAADLVPVTVGEKTSGIDAALRVGGSINGTVTDEATGDPLSGICVDVNDPSFIFFGSTTTDSSGNYSVGGLASAEYSVQFYDCSFASAYLPEWYDNRLDAFVSDLVPVTPGEKTMGIDAALAVGGSINGVVTDESSGEPLSNICVAAVMVAFGPGSSFSSTELDGSYTITGLPTGQYSLRFENCSHPATHFTEWYDDQPNVESADEVSVQAGQKLSGIDVQLTPGSSPANDDFLGSEPAPSLPYSTATSTLFAGTESVEPQDCAGIGGTVWYSYTPDEDVTLVADTHGSDFDTALAVYTGNSLQALTSVACNDDSGFTVESRVVFDATAGQTYYFQAGGFFGNVGNLVFNLRSVDPVDMTGIWRTVLRGDADATCTQDVTQEGTTLVFEGSCDVTRPTEITIGGILTGTIDPATLEFFVSNTGGFCNGSSRTGTISPDGSTITGTWSCLGFVGTFTGQRAVMLVGDASCDGAVNAIDAALVLQFNAGLLGSLDCQDGADVNGDGDITSIDAALILQFTAGLLDMLGQSPSDSGQAIMVRRADGFTSIDEMGGTTICLLQGTTKELNLADRFASADLDYTPLTFEENGPLEAAFTAEACDGWAGDADQLAERQSTYPPEDGGPESLALLPF